MVLEMCPIVLPCGKVSRLWSDMAGIGLFRSDSTKAAAIANASGVTATALFRTCAPAFGNICVTRSAASFLHLRSETTDRARSHHASRPPGHNYYFGEVGAWGIQLNSAARFASQALPLRDEFGMACAVFISSAPALSFCRSLVRHLTDSVRRKTSFARSWSIFSCSSSISSSALMLIL
jgi:hypothetical protein